LPSESLWNASAQAAMVYRGPQVLNAGFAGAPVSMDDIEGATVKGPASSGPLVAYVRVIALRRGDVQRLTLRAADGTVLAQSAPATADHDKAQAFMLVGKSTATAWPKGTYSATYTITRSGAEVLRRDWSQTY